MAELFTQNLLLRIGGKVMTRHGVWAVAGPRRGPVEVPITFSRADPTTCARYFDRDGLSQVAAANVPRGEWVDLDGDGIRETLGLFLEGTRINIVLHNRDLRITHQLGVSGGAGTFIDGETVNASGGGSGVYVLANSTSALFALRGGSGTMTGTLTGVTSGATRTIGSSALVWVAISMTVAKDQTGLDGIANSASKLTASGANATCLQAITAGSTQRAQFAYVKRITGSGTINMTMDNGSTWTVIALTTAWTKVTIPPQTLANPTVGFRIVTSGDVIAVDFPQNEAGAFESSPLATMTAAVTRASDSCTLGFNFGPVDITVLAWLARHPWMDAAGTIQFPGIFELSDNGSERLRCYGVDTTRTLQTDIEVAGAAGSSFASRSVPAGTSIKAAVQYKNLATAGQNAMETSAGQSAFGGAQPGFAKYANQTLRVGSVNGATLPYFGAIIDLPFARGLFSLAEISAIP